MRFDGVSKDVRYHELVSEFPLMSIPDDSTYRMAIEILDRLFILDKQRSKGELEYFRELAYLAFRYEQMTGMCDLRESNTNSNCHEGVLA